MSSVSQWQTHDDEVFGIRPRHDDELASALSILQDLPQASEWQAPLLHYNHVLSFSVADPRSSNGWGEAIIPWPT